MSTYNAPLCETCGQPIPPLPPRDKCTCNHGIGFHDIARNGDRTACSVVTRKGACGCKEYVPAEVADAG